MRGFKRKSKRKIWKSRARFSRTSIPSRPTVPFMRGGRKLT